MNSPPPSKRPAHLPIYVINLARKPERLKHMQQQAQDLGIELQRVAAVDGHDLRREQVPPCLHQALDGTGRYYRALSFPEIAITMSHRLCWEKIARFTQHRYGVILEDDCLIKPDFPLLFDFLERLDVQCDFLSIMDRHLYPKHKRTSFRCIVRMNRWQLVEWRSNLSGAYGYVISPKFARALMAATGFSQVLEHVMITVAWKQRFCFYGVHPEQAPIRLNRTAQSDSDNARSLKKKQKRSELKRVRYQLWFALMMVRHHCRNHGLIASLPWPKCFAAK